MDSGRHLLVQAGTGTGKSLGYLAPALVRLTQQPGERIVVATATLALQSQLANADIPAALDAVEAVTGERPRHAILKGRTNYACLLKVRDGSAQDQAALISAGDLAATIKAAPLATPESALGAEVLALREWAEEQAGRRRPGRPRRRPVAHRAGLAAGVHPGPGVPGPAALPVRRRLLRREVPRRGPGGRPGGDQPRAAGHRRDARWHRAARAPPRWSSTRRTSWSARVTGAASAELTPGAGRAGRLGGR